MQAFAKASSSPQLLQPPPLSVVVDPGVGALASLYTW